MKTRIIWGIVYGITLISVFVCKIPLVYIAAISIVALWSCMELFTMLSQQNEATSHSLTFYKQMPSVILALGVLITQLVVSHYIVAQFIALPLLLLFAVFMYELFYGKANNSLHNLAYFSLAFVYIVLPLALSSVIIFSHGQYLPYRLLGIFILIWTCDTMQYFSGKALGKHKLYERISPNKTWEGAIGGILFTIVAGFILSKLWLEFTTIQWLCLAAIVAVMGIVGDLVESMLKRLIGVKDSGNFMPGHGGILDRFDSFLFVMPFAAVYCWIMC